MEEFLRYLIEPELFPPEIVRIIYYVRFFVLGISGLMVVAVVYFIVSTDLLEEKYFKDVLEFSKASPYKEVNLSKNWSKVRKKIESDDPSERKLAIVEADDLLQEIFEKMGYEGENLEKMLENISSDIVTNKEELIKAHRTRRDLVYDPGFEISAGDARELLEIYEETLKDLQVI